MKPQQLGRNLLPASSTSYTVCPDCILFAIRLLSLAGVMLVAACAHQATRQDLKISPAESGVLGRIGIATGRYQPPASISPDKLGFMKSPAQDVYGGTVSGVAAGGIFWCIPCVPPAAALGAIFGAGYGVYAAGGGLYQAIHPKFDRAFGALEATFSKASLADIFEQALLTAGGKNFPVSTYPGGPASVDDKPDYADAQRFDSVLEVRLTKVTLESEDKTGPFVRNLSYDSPRALCMDARARVIRTRDQAVLHDVPYRFKSQGQTLAAWTADSDALFKEVLHGGVESLASDIARDVFTREGDTLRQESHPGSNSTQKPDDHAC